MAAEPEEAREFGRAFLSFLTWLHQGDHASHGNPVVAAVRTHLSAEGLNRSVVSTDLPVFEQVNLQVALDTWSAEEGRSVSVQGLTMPPHFGALDLQQLLHGDGLPPVRLSSPDLVDLPSGPERTLACLKQALLMVHDDRGRYVVLVRGPERHEEPSLSLEIAGLATEDAQAVLRELAELRSTLNVYRGQLLELVPDQMGVRITFASLPATPREDVVLPEEVLRRVERHTLDIATHREHLRAAGQHLKRGLLLYGPPGTGKTHTTRYVVQQLTGTTVLMLSGQSLHLIGMVSQLARDLQPSVVVLEDVDLVAEDREFGPGPSSVLFELLDSMDGAAADADLLFLLTTNRADLLEPALAARPGRIDVAVEIGLPDAQSRRRLFEVYSRGVPLDLTEDQIAETVERLDGVTASFVKELLRRAVLEALDETGGPLTAVRGEHLSRALDDLLDSAQSVTRALLGVTADQSGPPQLRPAGHRHGGMDWATGGYPSAYGSSWFTSFDPDDADP